ncbi:MAG: hypothetical protein D6713_01320 [Deltaproteobacteria bacterium]|nr:MAG: hypothetical protein D6713_01320 [Deltaproteobacteria bacterium]
MSEGRQRVSLTDFISPHLAEEICRDEKARLILVIGGVDTGKTTFVYSLAGSLAGSSSVAVVDLDVGQSHVGPPSTAGWGLFDPDSGEVREEGFVFTGTFSPRGNLLPVLTASAEAVRAGRRMASRVVVDTTGYVSDSSARILKQMKIDLLRPDLIIALSRSGELSHILTPYLRCRNPRILIIPVQWPVREKTMEFRFSYRIERLRKYFAGASLKRVTLNSRYLRFTRYPPFRSPQEPLFLEERLVSLRSRGNRDICLGYVTGVKREGEKLLIDVLLPGERTPSFSHLLVGEARVSRQILLSGES